MFWLDNRYYIKSANDDRRKNKLPLYKKPRFYLVDDLNGTIVYCGLTCNQCVKVYSINHGHLFWKSRNNKIIHHAT